MVDFGITLKTLRTQNNYTQVQLAQKLGLTKSVISAYETGLRLPSYDVLINIAKSSRSARTICLAWITDRKLTYLA